MATEMSKRKLVRKALEKIKLGKNKRILGRLQAKNNLDSPMDALLLLLDRKGVL